MDCSYLQNKIFAIFFHVNSTHIFMFDLIKLKRLNCWYLVLFINKTDRQTNRQKGRQQSSVLYNLMQMEVFFSYKNATAIAMNRLTLLSLLTFRMNDFTC